MSRSNLYTQSKGFTLIEVLVTIGLIAIVAGISVPNFRKFSQTQEIDAATQKLVDMLRSAQASAASHIKCPNGESSNNWSIVLSPTSYKTYANCADLSDKEVSSGSYTSGEASSTQFKLVSDRCGSQDLAFVFTNRQLSYKCSGVVGSAWPITISLKNQGESLVKEIIVEQGGVIRIK